MAAFLTGAWLILLSSSLGESRPTCVYTEGGLRWDLTSLSRADGREDAFFIASFDQKFQYYFSLCGGSPNGDNMPPECDTKRLSHAQSPVYQVNHGLCYWLGSVDQQHYEKGSKTGIDLVYNGGEPCNDGRHREVRFHLICANVHSRSGDDGPLSVVEEKEKCRYNITWPTPHACPTHVRSVLSLLFYLLTAVGGLFWFGLPFVVAVQNVVVHKQPFDARACLRENEFRACGRAAIDLCRAVCGVSQRMRINKENFETRFPMEGILSKEKRRLGVRVNSSDGDDVDHTTV